MRTHYLLALILSFGCSQSKDSNTGGITQPVQGAAVVGGNISSSSPQCNSITSISVRNSTTGTALYPDIQVNPGGSFEVQVPVGSFNILAVNSMSCYAQQSITTEAGKIYRITLPLVYGQIPWGGSGGWSNGGGSWAGSAGVYTGWSENPCSWGSYGCNGTQYPGTGGIIAGKPNVYLSGPANQDFSVQILFHGKSNLLAAAPIHGPNGWKGKIVSEGKLLSDGSPYDYLYYDARVDLDILDTSTYACMPREKTLTNMIEYLRAKGFVDREIKDFEDYWKNRIPALPQYCIYIQDESSIQKVAEMKISPKPDKLTQVWFVLVPQTEPVASLKNKFSNKPKIMMSNFKKPVTRSIASTSEKSEKPFEIREWGIAFLVE